MEVGREPELEDRGAPTPVKDVWVVIWVKGAPLIGLELPLVVVVGGGGGEVEEDAAEELDTEVEEEELVPVPVVGKVVSEV